MRTRTLLSSDGVPVDFRDDNLTSVSQIWEASIEGGFCGPSLQTGFSHKALLAFQKMAAVGRWHAAPSHLSSSELLHGSAPVTSYGAVGLLAAVANAINKDDDFISCTEEAAKQRLMLLLDRKRMLSQKLIKRLSVTVSGSDEFVGEDFVPPFLWKLSFAVKADDSADGLFQMTRLRLRTLRSVLAAGPHHSTYSLPHSPLQMLVQSKAAFILQQKARKRQSP